MVRTKPGPSSAWSKIGSPWQNLPASQTPLTALTLVPSPASWAVAVASKPVTCAPIKAAAVEMTTSPIVSRKALCKSKGRDEDLAFRARALPRRRQPNLPAPWVEGKTLRCCPLHSPSSWPEGHLPPRPDSSPFSQAKPVQPSGHTHWPKMGSQLPPFRHRQECRQFLPYRPAGQAGAQEAEASLSICPVEAFGAPQVSTHPQSST